MRVCVLGLGYIGLPTAASLAVKGHQVTGVDVSPAVLESLHARKAHFKEPELTELLERALESGNLTIAKQPPKADAFVVAVPTPLGDDQHADLRHVIDASEAVAPVLEAGDLVVIESTCPPRTTVEIVQPILERSGLQAGDDFHLAYTPERALPGSILHEMIHNDRVIGGVDAASAEAGRDLYATFVEGEILLTDATTAEMVKLLENASRDINIAIANEFSGLAELLGVNVWEAIELANRHPRIEILRPGPGVGGHCIAVDPWFLVERNPDQSPLIRQARQINDGQPAHSVRMIARAVGDLRGTRIAALGLAYKPNVDDLRSSPAVEVVRLLIEAGAEVRTYEPFAPSAAVDGAQPADSVESVVTGAQAVVMLVNHDLFAGLDPAEVAAAMPGRVAIDLRGVWDRARWSEAGFVVHTLGVGEVHA